MDNSPAIYLGKIVSKKHFRTFIYSIDGSKKLVESWDEYQAHVETGIWFAVNEERVIVKEKEKNKPKRARKAVEKEETPQEFIDDFLPKEGSD